QKHESTQAQQKAIDVALVSPADLLEFMKCNMRLKTDIKPKEATFQVVLDALSPRCVYFKEKQEVLDTTRDDTMYNSMRCFSKHEKTQVYGTILPKELIDLAMLESKAYQTYYTFASREKDPKLKYVQKNADFDTSPKQKPVQATKAEQLKLATKRSKKYFHISHVSGSGDGVDTQSKVLDEKQQKTSGVDEGTGTTLGVLDVPIYDSESDKESWGDSNEEDDDEDDFEVDDRNEHEEEDVDERVQTPLDCELTDDEKIHDEENIDKEEEDEVTKELYDDVNVNLGNKDTEMINADQGPTQSSSVSSEFTSKLLNIDNPSPADNEIASLIDTTAHHATTIPKITSSFTTTIPPPPPFFNPLSQQATPTPTPTASETTSSLFAILYFTFVIKFNERVFNLEKDLSEIKQVDQYAQALYSIHAISSYEATATLSKFELTKILIDKMEKNKSFDVANYKIELYDALVKSYNTDKDIFESYGEVFSLKRSRDERDKDRDPSAVLDRGTHRRKSSKDAESSRDSKSKEKSLQVPLNTPPNLNISLPISLPMQRSQVMLLKTQASNKIKSLSLETMMNKPMIRRLPKLIELEYHLEECSKATTERLDWHNPENKPYPFNLRTPLLLIQDHRGRQIIPKNYFINKDLEYLKGGDLSRKYLTSVTKTKAATYELKWIEDLVPKLWSPVQLKYDQHAYLDISHWGPKRQIFYGYASNLTSSKDLYSIRRIIAVTRLKIMKKYDYSPLEEIKVCCDDQKLYTFEEGDFKRLRLQDIEDMLLLHVQQKLTNLTIDERDGTLNDVRSALHDIAAGIRMEYLPIRKWSNLDKKRAWVMVQDIDKQLYQRRLMRNQEKFVCGRVYENDLRLLKRTI
nr:hypothetical protein [Tanacetum cinerariifolium]